MTEIWKPIAEFEDLYQVSSNGRIQRITSVKPRVLKPYPDGMGYLRVELFKKGTSKQIYVHRLVANAFIPNNNQLRTQVNHKNFNLKDNRVDNLDWMTPEENRIYTKGITILILARMIEYLKSQVTEDYCI